MLDYLKKANNILIIFILLVSCAFAQQQKPNRLQEERAVAEAAVNDITTYIERQLAQQGFCFDVNPQCHSLNQYHVDSMAAIMVSHGWDFNHYSIVCLLTPNRRLFIRLQFPSLVNPDLMYGASWEIIEKVVPIPKKGDKYHVESTGIFTVS
jgi:hypothetical protein